MSVFPFRKSPSSASASLGSNRRSAVSPPMSPRQESWQRVRSQVRTLELLNPNAALDLEKLLADLIGDCRR